MNMRIVLDKKTQKFITDKVSAGEFEDPSQVVREALALLRHQDLRKRDRLRKAIQKGLNDLENGNYVALKPDEIGTFLKSIRPKSLARKTPQRLPRK
jgi:putative addiction module CopG family antidote